MRRSRVAIFVTLLFSVLTARADSSPTYSITQGSITIGSANTNIAPQVVYQFSGQGFSITGSGYAVTNFAISGAPGGYGPLDAGFSIGTDYSDGNLVSGTIGGVYYPSLLFFSSIASGPSFSLPTGNQSAFSIKLPVTFSGIPYVCVFDMTTAGCISTVPGNFNISGTGTAELNYVNSGGSWYFNSGTFTLSPVPEPGTFVLMGSGLAALVGFVRRRR